MSDERIIIGTEGRRKLQSGVKQLSDAVKVTLGPKGRNVLIEKTEPEDDIITKDGVTVSDHVFLSNKIENMGASMVKKVARRTDNLAGDGTTTASVLANAILEEGMRVVEAGADPIELKKGIDFAVDDVLKSLELSSIEVTSKKMIKQVATISANNDEEIGAIVAKAFELAGKNGVVTVEDSSGFDTYVESVSGMHFDRGFVSDYFATDTKNEVCNLVNPYIMTIDNKLSNAEHLINLLEAVKAKNGSLVIIAHDIVGQALATLVSNKMHNIVEIVAIKAPGHGKYRTQLLEDIAISIGSQVCQDPSEIEEQAPKFLGRSTSIRVDRFNTTIVGGNATDAALKTRVDEITELISNTPEGSERSFLEGRLAKLDGGVGVIYVGSISEVEAREKKDRIIDATNAVRSAKEEGVIPGGGLALLQASHTIATYTNMDVNLGAKIVKKACLVPMKTIAENAGMNGEVVLNEVSRRVSHIGYDAKNDKYVNMVAKGIIDPVKVTRCALQNAASVSGMILTTECIILKECLK